MAERGSHRGRKRAAIVGSGFGGLAAAVRLQAAGLDTVLFEARDQPGGRAYVYREAGYTFDGGPTVITAPDCLDELFALAGKRRQDYVDFLPVTPFYRLIWQDGTALDYGGGDSLLNEIARLSPSDAEGYLRFVEYSRKVFQKGYTELAHAPFLRFGDMLKVAPSLARLRADRSVYATVSRFVKHEKLREALSFHSLLVGGNPFETSSIYTLIHYLERNWGVFFPRGGTGALVAALVKLYEQLGGELRLDCPVQRITVSRGASVRHLVRSKAGVDEPFDLVVSNSDLHHTYSRLYGAEAEAQKTAKKLERAAWSMSLFVLYFGTDRAYDLAHHTVVFGPRYRGLLEDVFHGHALPDDFSLYLHAPSVTDASLAPPGGATFYVLSPVPHLGNAPLDWDQIGDRYGDRILEALERHMPNLREHVVVKRSLTPRGFARDLFAYQGSAFSIAPKLTQSAWFRPHNRDPKIPGLYLVGAGTHPGAGVPGVVSSAKATAGLVLKDYGISGHFPTNSEAAE